MLYTSQNMPEKRKYFQLRGLWVRSGPGKFQDSYWNMPCDGMCDEKTSYYDPVCPSSVCRSVAAGSTISQIWFRGAYIRPGCRASLRKHVPNHMEGAPREQRQGGTCTRLARDNSL